MKNFAPVINYLEMFFYFILFAGAQFRRVVFSRYLSSTNCPQDCFCKYILFFHQTYYCLGFQICTVVEEVSNFVTEVKVQVQEQQIQIQMYFLSKK